MIEQTEFPFQDLKSNSGNVHWVIVIIAIVICGAFFYVHSSQMYVNRKENN